MVQEYQHDKFEIFLDVFETMKLYWTCWTWHVGHTFTVVSSRLPLECCSSCSAHRKVSQHIRTAPGNSSWTWSSLEDEDDQTRTWYWDTLSIIKSNQEALCHLCPSLPSPQLLPVLHCCQHLWPCNHHKLLPGSCRSKTAHLLVGICWNETKAEWFRMVSNSSLPDA